MRSGGDRSSLFARWGAFAACHARRVVAVWLAVFLAAGALTPQFLSHLSGASLAVRGSGSQRAEALLQEKFGARATEQDVLVFHSDRLALGDAAFSGVVRDAVQAMQRQQGVAAVASPLAPGAQGQVSRDGHTALAPVGLSGGEMQRQARAAELQAAARRASASGVQVYLTGTSPLNAALIDRENTDLRTAELIGVPVALLVLLLAFGTLAAAALPLLLGLSSVLVAFGVLGAASFATSINVFVESVVAMLGTALGIDYALFLVTRYREELGAGAAAAPAVAATMATAGKAVLVSGSTVLISLAGLLVVRADVFTALALGVMLTVAIMLAVTLTLLPAVLGMLGDHIHRLALPLVREAVRHPDPERSIWGRLAHGVMRHPVAIGAAVLAVLLALGAPVLALRLGFDQSVSALGDAPAAAGYRLVSTQFSPGVVSPLQIVATDPAGRLDAGDLDAVARLTAALRRIPGVAQATSLTGVLDATAGAHSPQALAAVLARPGARAAGLDALVNLRGGLDTTVVIVSPAVSPDSRAAGDLVSEVRGALVPRALRGTGLESAAGGLSAQIADLDQEVARAQPVAIALVLAASFALLLLAFRSLLLPLQAIAANLLSVGAAYGLLVAVFQEGAGERALAFRSPGFIQVYIPLLAFAVLFGLSMDYEVFLVSRIKEEWGRTHDHRAAVASGIAHTARVITAAAAIMVTVFASFLVAHSLELKQVGFALAVSVLVDATLIRLLLVPAALRLLGPATWYAPRWLRRLPPPIELAEGAPPEREHPGAGAA